MSIRYRILAVFREDENMRAALKLLENKGYDVVSETSVFQAIVNVTESNVDAVFLDIDDLTVNEMEFLDVIKKVSPHLFVLISFSHAHREKAIKYLERGADCYIIKPFYISELYAIIHKQKTFEKHKSIEHLALRVAQEINNPLTTISGLLQLRLSQMERGNPDYPVYETLEEEAGRIAETVRSLMAFAQPREPEMKVVNVNEILGEMIRSCREEWRDQQGREVQIVESFDRDLPLIMADKEQLAFVCRNIMDNSRRALKGGGGLKVATKRGTGNDIKIAIYDSGRGIPADVVKRVFDPFFVVNEEERGMGLGLCVSHEIIKRHGGSLTVKSQLGKGTLFQITLPVEPC